MLHKDSHLPVCSFHLLQALYLPQAFIPEPQYTNILINIPRLYHSQ